MNTQFRHMQKLAFGNSLPINENEFKNKIRELVYSSLNERKKKKEKQEDVAPQEDVDAPEPTEQTPDAPSDTITPDTSGDINPTVKSIQDSLQKAFAQAKSLGDEKLTAQIGNTITMLVRTQVLGNHQGINENISTTDDELSQQILDKGIENKDKGEIFFDAWHLAVNSGLTDEEAWEIYSKGNVNIK